MRTTLRLITASVALAAASIGTAVELPPPESHLGFKPGADYKMAGWAKIESYFREIGRRSDRVRIEELGPSTDGRRMIAAIISAPSNLEDLDRLRLCQAEIADPRRVRDPEARRKAPEGTPIVVLVSCGLHASEWVSTHTSTVLLHELAAGDSPRLREILEGAIVLLVPSANPDGADLVAEWYARSLGKPWEGDGMPWLYHKYADHDNNRDWFALNLRETINLSRVLYQEWAPTIVVDLHQQGQDSSRIALPPYHNPMSPNIPTQVSQAQLVLGGHMAAELARQGKPGAVYGVNYDLWYHGAFRSTPNRHNMVGILTECASTRLATPIFLRKKDLKGAPRGLPEYAAAVNFSDPWPGGWWRPADIVDYQRITTLALLTAAVRHRDLFQDNQRQMAEDAIAKGSAEPPRAWLVPERQTDRGAAVRMLRSLHGTGIEVHRAEETFTADGVAYPAGTWLLYADQPYRPHLADMMQRQEYPERTGADGKPEMPYDIAGWTLPLQMGVRCVEVAERPAVRARKLDAIEEPAPRIAGAEGAVAWLILPGANDGHRLVNRLHRRQVDVSVLDVPVARLGAPAGALLVATAGLAGAGAEDPLRGLGVDGRGLTAKEFETARGSARPLKAPRLAVYQPWLPCIDEGWTRLALEQFEFPYVSLHNAELRAGQLNERFDCIVLPSMSAAQLLEGQPRDATEAQYTGGIGEEGVLRLQEFVAAGGWLVAIDASCQLLLRHFTLPVRDALTTSAGTRTRLARDKFFCPGSILGVTLDAAHPIAWGRSGRVPAFFAHSQAFEIVAPGKEKEVRDPARLYPAKVVARYADTLLLESGYLKGEEHLAGKPALVEVAWEKGRVVLFGFRVQHRCHTHATLRLLFNAIRASTLAP